MNGTAVRRFARTLTIPPREAAAIFLWLLASVALFAGGLEAADNMDAIVQWLFVGGVR